MKNKKKLILIMFILVISLFIATGISVALFDDTGGGDDYIEVYKNNSEIFVQRSIFKDIGRYIGFGIVKFLAFLSLGSETLFDNTFKLIDITNDEIVVNFIEEFKPLLVGIMALVLIYLGAKLILGLFKSTRIDINILIFVLVISSSTMIFSFMNNLIINIKEGIDEIPIGTEESTNSTYSIIDKNMIDLVALGDSENGRYKGLDKLDYKHRIKKDGGINQDFFNSGINDENFKYIDYNEALNYDSEKYNWSDESETILSNYLVYTPSELYTAEIDNGWGWNSDDDNDTGSGFYYRYQINHFNTDIQLLSLILIYVALSYKSIRLIYEIIISRLGLYLYSADLAGGEKTRRIITSIKDSYITLLVAVVSVKVFEIFSLIISTRISNTFVQGFLSLFIAFAVIDGPNIAQKVLGIDAGLGSSTARMLALYGGVKGLAHTGYRLGKNAKDKLLGKKTPIPTPQDGKRHGGLKDKFNGTTKAGKEMGHKNWKNQMDLMNKDKDKTGISSGVGSSVKSDMSNYTSDGGKESIKDSMNNDTPSQQASTTHSSGNQDFSNKMNDSVSKTSENKEKLNVSNNTAKKKPDLNKNRSKEL